MPPPDIQSIPAKGSLKTQLIIRRAMEELENVPKQIGTAILDFDGKLIKVRGAKYLMIQMINSDRRQLLTNFAGDW